MSIESIASEFQDLKTNLSSAYSSVESKCGTIPTDKNTDNLADAIDSIPSGEETFWSEYGAKYTKNMVFPAGINIAGYLYQNTTNLESVEFEGAVSIGAYAFNNAIGLMGKVMDIKTSTIGNYSFQKTYLSKLICGTSSLTQSGIRGINDRGTGNLTIKLLKTCTSILNYNFYGNPHTTIDLTDFDVDDDVPTITTSQQLMDSYVFKNQSTLEKFASATNWSIWASNFVVQS